MASVVSALLLIGLAGSSCGGGNSTTGPSSTNTTMVTRPSGSFAFRASPIDPAYIEFIAPLGNLNPPGHTLPTDHIYLYHRLNNMSAPSRTVVAPADGTIQTIINNGSSSERKLLIAAAFPFTYYVDHVVPDAAIREGLTLTAGQRIGVTGTDAFALDLGVFSDAITVPFANPARYTSESLHGDSPIRYFDEPFRGQLYGLVRRSGGDRDGTFNYDIPGRLIGNWFADGLAPSQSQQPSGWPLHLAFVYDNYDPSMLRISSGGALGVVGAFAVAPGTPEPRDVSAATGKVVYRLLTGGSSVVGVMVVQMMNTDRIHVEYQAGDRANSDFTANARIFVR